MHYGSELEYIARKKSPPNPYFLFIQHLTFCYLLVLSLICTTACWDLLEMKGELERADFN